MARVSDSLGQFVDLTPLRYEFENIPERQALAASRNANRPPGAAKHVFTEDDANWLVVQFTAFDGQKQWSVADPFLQVQDLQRLANWARSLADSRPDTKPYCGGIELTLQWEAAGRGEATRLHAIMSGELHPSGRGHRGGPHIIVLSPGFDELHRFADDIEYDLLSFPVRQISVADR